MKFCFYHMISTGNDSLKLPFISNVITFAFDQILAWFSLYMYVYTNCFIVQKVELQVMIKSGYFSAPP